MTIRDVHQEAVVNTLVRPAATFRRGTAARLFRRPADTRKFPGAAASIAASMSTSLQSTPRIMQG